MDRDTTTATPTWHAAPWVQSQTPHVADFNELRALLTRSARRRLARFRQGHVRGGRAGRDVSSSTLGGPKSAAEPHHEGLAM